MMLSWTKVWLDAETDGFEGRLLSIALVAEDGSTFYGALPAMHMRDDWAIRHVQPVLGPPTHSDDIALADDIARWLRRFEAAEVIADWHRDLSHFFLLLGPVPGRVLPTCPLRASYKPWLNGAVGAEHHGPMHNAKADAMRLRDADLADASWEPDE